MDTRAHGNNGKQKSRCGGKKREGLSPSNRLPAPLRRTLPRSKSAVQQEFIQKLKIASEMWKESLRYERMVRIDLTHKINNFGKLTHNLHCKQANLLFQLYSFNSGQDTYYSMCISIKYRK